MGFVKRPVSIDFIAAMNERLERDLEMGKRGWDSRWIHIYEDDKLIEMLRIKLHEEVEELFDVLNEPDDLRLEAADVANIAMMIADIAGALKDE